MGKTHLSKRSATSVVKKTAGGNRNAVALARRLLHGQNQNTTFARAAMFGRR